MAEGIQFKHVGLVSRQWEAVDCACVLCDHRVHNDGASRSDQIRSMLLPILHLSCRLFFFFCKTSRHPGLSAPIQPRFGSLRFLAFPKVKIAVEREEICECDSHITQAQSTASHRRLTSPTEEWLFTDVQ